VIRFRIGSDGTLSDIKMTKSSGTAQVDDACVSSAQQTRKVPPPPGGRARNLSVECE
jgi:TonB family protein